jgi:hypothetical protein
MRPVAAVRAVPCRFGLISAVVASLIASPAIAGIYADELSKCLVRSSSSDDRVVLIQWMFAAFSLHPAVQPIVSVNPEQRDVINKKTATVFSRLLAEDCRKETIDALKYEGDAAIGTAFRVLGEAASRDLMSEPHVAKGLGELVGQLANDQKFKDLIKDAGFEDKK